MGVLITDATEFGAFAPGTPQKGSWELTRVGVAGKQFLRRSHTIGTISFWLGIFAIAKSFLISPSTFHNLGRILQVKARSVNFAPMNYNYN